MQVQKDSFFRILNSSLKILLFSFVGLQCFPAIFLFQFTFAFRASFVQFQAFFSDQFTLPLSLKHCTNFYLKRNNGHANTNIMKQTKNPAYTLSYSHPSGYNDKHIFRHAPFLYILTCPGLH